jgi:acyl carrier protein
MWLSRKIGQTLKAMFRERRYVGELDDDDFYRLHYGNTTVPKEIPIRLRKLCVKQLGRRWILVKPEDCLVDDELDFYELLLDIAEEFGISIPDEDMDQMDATFDSVVRYLAEGAHKERGQGQTG